MFFAESAESCTAKIRCGWKKFKDIANGYVLCIFKDMYVLCKRAVSLKLKRTCLKVV